MGKYLLHRFLQMIPVLFLVSLVVFVLAHMALGDPVVLMLGEDADQKTIARLREQLGFSRPLYVQYIDWMSHIVKGDFGRSFRLPYPVSTLILNRLPITLELALLSLLLSVIIAIPTGVYAALRHNSKSDLFTSGVAVIGVSMPNFWLGILLIFIFALKLGWLPSSGYISPFESMIGNLKLMILPSITLSMAYVATLTRIVRSSMLEVLGQEYVLTARSKGLTEKRVIFLHALKNAILPVVTVIGVSLGRQFGGAVVTETVFNLPGIGRLLVDAILGRDFSVVQGVVLFTTFTILIMNLIVDLLYSYLDPRIKYA